MSKTTPVVILASVLVGAGAFALFQSSSSSSAQAQATTATAAFDQDIPRAPSSGLPPGHPAIGSTSADPMSAMAAPSETVADAAITWTVPPAWKTATSPSTMRLASYRVAHAPGDTEDADVSVVRAGGTPEANIERWLGQFDQAGKDTRVTRTVRGLNVTVVEVQGTFLGSGMTTDAPAVSRADWALLAAIVESPGQPYFFKMVGPAKTVASARRAFDGLVSSITPASP